MSDQDETTPVEPEDGWRRNARGQQFIAARGRSGTILRKGTETVDEALARDAVEQSDKGKGRPPRKPGAPGAKPTKQPTPTRVDLKLIERELAEALKAPAMAAAAFGEEWMAEHFKLSGPILARNLCAAAEHDPWLRSKLEAFASGPDVLMRIMSMMTISGSVVFYAAPPVLYVFTSPGEGRIGRAREMFGVPERKPKEEPDAAPPAPAQAPAAPTA